MGSFPASEMEIEIAWFREIAFMKIFTLGMASSINYKLQSEIALPPVFSDVKQRPSPTAVLDGILYSRC